MAGTCTSIRPRLIGSSSIVELSRLINRAGVPFSVRISTRRKSRTRGHGGGFTAPASSREEGPSCIFVGPIDSARKETLEALYRQARDAYYNGKPLIVDDMFDRVELKLRWYGSESVVKYLWCSLLRQSTYADAELYKGCLSEGIAVTVRCIKLKQKSLPQSLDQHMEVLSKLRHMHLVRVLGHCIASNHDHHQHAGHTTFSVQEYISNESLRDFLTDCRKKEVLKWPQRMAIDIGVARGIQFLHMGVAQGIFRKSLEIENILLAETLTVKISGYTIPLPSKGWSREPSSQKSSK